MSRYVSVEVDINDVIDGLDDDDLIEELRERGKAVAAVPVKEFRERIDTIMHEVRMGRSGDALRMMQDLSEEFLRMENSVARELQTGSLEIRK